MGAVRIRMEAARSQRGVRWPRLEGQNGITTLSQAGREMFVVNTVGSWRTTLRSRMASPLLPTLQYDAEKTRVENDQPIEINVSE